MISYFFINICNVLNANCGIYYLHTEISLQYVANKYLLDNTKNEVMLLSTGQNQN